MGNIKQINTKNFTYCSFNEITNIKIFHWNLLKIDKKSNKNIDIYYVGYATIKNIGDYESVHSVNPLYLIIGEADGKKKYLVFASVDKNKKVLTKHIELWDWIKNLIEKNQVSMEKISWRSNSI